MLTEAKLEALKQATRDGWIAKSHGLKRLQLLRKRDVYDEVRHRRLEMGDFVPTAWGRQVAHNYKHSVERLPVGTYLNHRIHAYQDDTVVLADDSGSLSTVDTSKPMRVSPACWWIPLQGGGRTPGTDSEGWYLRNLLGMAIELDPNTSPDDFRAD
jgi:hypothetical protein